MQESKRTCLNWAKFSTLAFVGTLFTASSASHAADYAIVQGSYYTTNLATSLLGAGQNVSEITSYSTGSLASYDAVVMYGNTYTDIPALEDYVQNGGKLILTPWSGLNYSVPATIQVFSNGGNAVYSEVYPGITVLDPSNSIVSGVSFPAPGGFNIGRITGITFAPGAVAVANWADGVPFIGVTSYGEGVSIGINLQVITSDTAYTVIDQAWATQIFVNAAQYVAGNGFVSSAQTPNQIAVASGLADLAFADPLLTPLLLQDDAGSRQAFDALSGEIHASVAGVLLDQSRVISNAIFSRMLQASYFGGSQGPSPLGSSGPVVAMAGGQPMMGLGGPRDDEEIPQAPSDLSLWMMGIGNWGHLDSNGNAASLDRSLGGAVMGGDARLDNGWRMGFAAGFTKTNADVDQRNSSADIDSYHIAGYGSGNILGLAARGGAAWSWHHIDTDRAIIFPGFFERADASYDGHTGQLFGELALPLMRGTTAVEPFARLSLVHVSTDGFSEQGGIAALSSSSNEENTQFMTLGLRAATEIAMDGRKLTPHISIGWLHAFGDVESTSNLALTGRSVSYLIAGTPIAEDSAVIDAGIDYNMSETATFGFAYSGQIGSDADDHSVSGRLNWRF